MDSSPNISMDVITPPSTLTPPTPSMPPTPSPIPPTPMPGDQPQGAPPLSGTQESHKKRVVIALPGKTFTNNFLRSWTQALYSLWEKKYDIVITCEYSSFVPFSRMQTLGLDVGRGPDQVPFNGEIPYDVWVSIDSDIVFTAEQLIELIENTESHPVVSGVYKMQDTKHYTCIQKWDEAYFRENKTFQFLVPDDLDKYKAETSEKFMKVSYNGMGFFACKKGVIEKLKYPYFHRELQNIRDENGKVIMVDMCSEDVAFCKNLTDAGFSIYINCDLRVGHEKSYVI
jgi:hypothetical protein